ncbi:Ig-like domain-containing protein, partial [Porticoccaceae bacterium]|nr:Ig-like domain-containing protein [Porticoccaceae bacterium]
MRESMAVLHFLQQKFDRAIKIVLAHSNYWTRSVFAILSRFDFSINRWSTASNLVDPRRSQTDHCLTKGVYHQLRLALSVFLICASSFMVHSEAAASTDYANGEFPDITTNEDTCPAQYLDNGELDPSPTCLSVFERGDTMTDDNGGTLRWEQAVDENDTPLFDDDGNIIYSGNLVYGAIGGAHYWSSGTSVSNRATLAENMASDDVADRLAVIKDPVVPCQASETCLPGRYLEVSVDGLFIYGDGKNVIWQPRLAQPSAVHAKGVTEEGFRLQLNSEDQQVELVNNHTGHIRWTSNDGYIPPPKVVYSLHTGTYTEDEQLMDIGQRKFLRFSRLNRGDVLLSIEENTFMQLNKDTGILELGQLPDDGFQVNINYDNEPDFVEKRRYIGLFDNENHLNSFFKTGSDDGYVFQGESFLREEGLLYYDVTDAELRYLQAGSSSGALTWVSAGSFIKWQEPTSQNINGIDRFEITDGGYRYLNLDAQGNVSEEVVKIEAEDDQDIIFSLRPQFCGITYTDVGGNDHDIEYCPMAWTFDLEHQEAGAPWEGARSAVVSGTSSALANRSSVDTSKTSLSSQTLTLWDLQQRSSQTKNMVQQATDSMVQMGLEVNHRNPGVRYTYMLAKLFGHQAWLNMQWWQTKIDEGYSYLIDAPRMVLHNTLATIEPITGQLTTLSSEIDWMTNYLSSANQLMQYAKEELATQLTLTQLHRQKVIEDHSEGWVESALVSATFLNFSGKLVQQNDRDLLTDLTELHQNLSSGISSSPQLKNFFTMAGYEGPWQDQTAPSGASESDVTPFADRALTADSPEVYGCDEKDLFCRWLTKKRVRFDVYPIDFRAMTKYPKGTPWRFSGLREKLWFLPSDTTLDGLMQQYSFQGSRLFLTWPKQTYKKLLGDDHEKLYTYVELRARSLNIAGASVGIGHKPDECCVNKWGKSFANMTDGGFSFVSDWVVKMYYTPQSGLLSGAYQEWPKLEFQTLKSPGPMWEITPSWNFFHNSDWSGTEDEIALFPLIGSGCQAAGEAAGQATSLFCGLMQGVLQSGWRRLLGGLDINGFSNTFRDYFFPERVALSNSDFGQMFSDNMHGRSLSDHVAANSLTDDTDTPGIDTILLEALVNLFTLWSSNVGWSDEEQTTFASDPALAYLSNSGKIVIGHLLNSTKRLMDCATTTSGNGDEVPNCALQPRPLSDLMSFNTDTDSFDFKNGMSDDIIFSMPAVLGLCDTDVFPARDDCSSDDNYWSNSGLDLGADTEAFLLQGSLGVSSNTTAMQLLEDLYALADTRYRTAIGVADQENIYGCNDDDPSWVCPRSVADRLALLKARFPSDNKTMQRFIHVATATETESQSSPARQLLNCNFGDGCSSNPFSTNNTNYWNELEFGGYTKPYFATNWEKGGDSWSFVNFFGSEAGYFAIQFVFHFKLKPLVDRDTGFEEWPLSSLWTLRDTFAAFISQLVAGLNNDHHQTGWSTGFWGAYLIIPWRDENDFFERGMTISIENVFGWTYYALNSFHDWQRDKVYSLGRDIENQKEAMEYNAKRRVRFQLNWDSGDHFGGTGESTFNWTETDTTTYKLDIQSDTANPNIGTTLTASVVELSSDQEIDFGLLEPRNWVWQRCDPDDTRNCINISNDQTYTLQVEDADKLIKAKLTFGFTDQNLKTYVALGESSIQSSPLVLGSNDGPNITVAEGELLQWNTLLSGGWGNRTCGLSGAHAHQFDTVQSVSNNGTVCTYSLIGYDLGKPDYELQSTFHVVIGGSDQNNNTKTQEIDITVGNQGLETIALNCGSTAVLENTNGTRFNCTVGSDGGYMAPGVRTGGSLTLAPNASCMSIENQTYDGTTFTFVVTPEANVYGNCSVTANFTNSQGVSYPVINNGTSALRSQNGKVVINRVQEQMQWNSTLAIEQIISVTGSVWVGWKISLAALPESSDFVTLDVENYTCTWMVDGNSYNNTACNQTLSLSGEPSTVAVTVSIDGNSHNLPFHHYAVTSESWGVSERRLNIEANHKGNGTDPATGTEAIEADHRSLAEASHETATSVGGSEGVVALENTIQIIHTGEAIPLTDDGLSFTWYQCSVECWWDDGSNWQQLDFTGTELSVNQADVGSLVKVDICYKDDPTDADQSCYFGSATVEVQNFNNDATGVPSIEGNPVVGQTLGVDVSAIADEDGLPLSGTSDFAYQWVRLDTPAGTETTIGSEASYDISVDDIGHTLVVRVSFVDLYGHGESVESEPTHIGLSNQPPVAVDTYVSTSMGQSITFNLMATDANGDTLTYQLVDDEPAPSGTLSIQTNGEAAYIPAADFSGTDRFYFFVADGLQSSPPAVVNITVHEGYLAGTSDSGTPIQPTMLGHTLVGDFSGDDTGSLVVFDDSGTLMAVSSPGVDDSQTGVANAGHVAVYAWDDTDHHWQQRGNHLLGSAESDKFGRSLALSGDGNVLAVGSPGAGHVQIYRFDAEQNQWLSDAHQISFTEAENTNFGHSITFNGDASMLAIGAPNADRCVGVACQSGAGAVMLYQSVADNTEQGSYNWLPIKRLQGSAANQDFGKQVVLSGRGDRLVVLSTPSGSHPANSVQTFDRTAVDWTHDSSQDISGGGDQLALSADGETLVVGFSGFAEDLGAATIYHYDSMSTPTGWSSKLSITGNSYGEKLGTAVAVSSDGGVVAAGAIGVKNHVKWFYWDQDTDNYSAANQLDNQQSDALFGSALALSSDGTRLVVGATNFEGNQFVPQRSGMAQAYALTNKTAQISGSLSGSVLWGSSVSGRLHTFDTAGLAVDSAYSIIDGTHEPSLALASVDPTSGQWQYYWLSDGFDYQTGQDSFVVTITDALGITYEQPIAIEVLPVNTAPEAFDVSLTVPRNNALPHTIFFESNDREGDDVSVKIDTYPQHGVLENCAGGLCDYRVSGTTDATADGFTYSACDASETYLCSDPAEVSLTIIQPNGRVEIDHQSMSEDFYIGETIVASIIDTDGVHADYSPTYVWSRAEGDNTVTTLGGGISYELVAADAGKHIILSVSYIDNEYVFETHTSPPIVPNHVDQDGTVTLSGMNSDGTVATKIELTAHFDDPDGYDGVIYRWQRSLDNTIWHEIDQHGHSSAYTLISDDIAHFVRVRVDYTDGFSKAPKTVFSTPVKMDSPGILNIRHGKSKVSKIKLNWPLHAHLEDDDGLGYDDAPVTVNYVWQRQDVDTDGRVVGWTAIIRNGIAHNDRHYMPLASDGVAGNNIRVLASYTDNRHYEYKYDDDSAVVSNAVWVDSPGVISFDKTNPLPGQKITASLADSDGYANSSLNWQWQRRLDANHVWENITQRTSATIKVGAKHTKGLDLRVCASYTDSRGIEYSGNDVCQEIPNQHATKANTTVSCSLTQADTGDCYTDARIGGLRRLSSVVDDSETESIPMNEDALLSIERADSGDSDQFPYVALRWYQCDPNTTTTTCGVLDSDDDHFNLSHWNMFKEQTVDDGFSEIDLSDYDYQDAIVYDHIVAEVCFVPDTAYDVAAEGAAEGAVEGAADGCLLSPVTIGVENVEEAPVFTSTPVTDATENLDYSYTVTTQDDDHGDTVTLSVDTDTMPTWLSFDSGAGTLTGKPLHSAVGDHQVTLDASDGTHSVQQSYTITVADVNNAPTISGTPATTVAEDAAYSFTPTASDDDGDPLTFSIVNKPNWASFSTTTGVLEGTPQNADVGNHA